MTVERIKVWRCDAATCKARDFASMPGWFDGVTVQGCPDHAEAVKAHKPLWRSDTQGRGWRAATRSSLVCACGWVPRTRWAYDDRERLEREHLEHLREATAPVPVPAPEEDL